MSPPNSWIDQEGLHRWLQELAPEALEEETKSASNQAPPEEEPVLRRPAFRRPIFRASETVAAPAETTATQPQKTPPKTHEWPAAPALEPEPVPENTPPEPPDAHFSVARSVEESKVGQATHPSPFSLRKPEPKEEGLPPTPTLIPLFPPPPPDPSDLPTGEKVALAPRSFATPPQWEEVSHLEIPPRLVAGVRSLRERVLLLGSWLLGQNIASGYCVIDQEGGVLAEEGFDGRLLLVATDFTRAWRRLEKAGGLPGERMSMPCEDGYLNVIPCLGTHGHYTFACRSSRSLSLPMARELGVTLKELLET